MKAVNIIWDIDTEDMEMCADNLDLPSGQGVCADY